MADAPSRSEIQKKMLAEIPQVIAVREQKKLEDWLTKYVGAETDPAKKTAIENHINLILDAYKKDQALSYDFYSNFYRFLSERAVDAVPKQRLAIMAELSDPDQETRQRAFKRENEKGGEHTKYVREAALRLVDAGVPVTPIDIMKQIINIKDEFLASYAKYFDAAGNFLRKTFSGDSKSSPPATGTAGDDLFTKKYDSAAGEPKKEEGKNDIGGWIAGAIGGILGWLGGGMFGNMLGVGGIGGMLFSIALAIGGFMMARGSFGDTINGMLGGQAKGDGKSANGQGQQLARGQGAAGQAQGVVEKKDFTQTDLSKLLADKDVKRVRSNDVYLVPVEGAFVPTITDSAHKPSGKSFTIDEITAKIGSCVDGKVKFSSTNGTPNSVEMQCSLPPRASATAAEAAR